MSVMEDYCCSSRRKDRREWSSWARASIILFFSFLSSFPLLREERKEEKR
jgi:hypothetical protein